MSEYTLECWDDSGGNEEHHFEERPTAEEIRDACEDYVLTGDWGEEGASIDVYWRILDPDGEEIDYGTETVEVEPDHESLIKAAVGRYDDDCCGFSPDDHDWTSEGEGGCTENPGVWSHGGTMMSFASHCRECGLRRYEVRLGSQRNPGEHDTVKYEMPE
jgi:hypothetical protein